MSESPIEDALSKVTGVKPLSPDDIAEQLRNEENTKKVWPFAVWCGWVCQVVTVLRSSLPQVR